MNIKLHKHIVQKNYSAIWYSLVVHMILLILAANLADWDLSLIFDNIKNELVYFVNDLSAPSKDYINQLLIEKPPRLA